MVFNKKGFFLVLEDGSKPSAPAVTVAPAKEAPAAKPAAKAKAAQSAAAAQPAQKAASAPADNQPKGPSLTTAEAIAAELAAAEAARPAVTLSTFAPEALQAGQALRPQRRRPGANLKGFRSMAADLFKS